NGDSQSPQAGGALSSNSRIGGTQGGCVRMNDKEAAQKKRFGNRAPWRPKRNLAFNRNVIGKSHVQNRSTVKKCGLRPQIQAKDALQFADGLRKSKGTVRARHD